MATAADHVLDRWRSSGGVVSTKIPRPRTRTSGTRPGSCGGTAPSTPHAEPQQIAAFIGRIQAHDRGGGRGAGMTDSREHAHRHRHRRAAAGPGQSAALPAAREGAAQLPHRGGRTCATPAARSAASGWVRPGCCPRSWSPPPPSDPRHPVGQGRFGRQDLAGTWPNCAGYSGPICSTCRTISGCRAAGRSSRCSHTRSRCARSADTWPRPPNGWRRAGGTVPPLDLDEQSRRLTLSALGRSVLGLDLGDHVTEIAEPLREALTYVADRALRPVRAPTWLPTRPAGGRGGPAPPCTGWPTTS